MSWQASSYAKRLRITPSGLPLTRNEKYLLLLLADSHNSDRHAAWPSVAALARDSFYSERQCFTILGSLERKGVLVIERRRGDAQRQMTNVYRFVELDTDATPHEETSVREPTEENGMKKRGEKSGVKKPAEVATAEKPQDVTVTPEPQDVTVTPEEREEEEEHSPARPRLEKTRPDEFQAVYELVKPLFRDGDEPDEDFLVSIYSAYWRRDLEEDVRNIRTWIEDATKFSRTKGATQRLVERWLADAEERDAKAREATPAASSNGTARSAGRESYTAVTEPDAALLEPLLHAFEMECLQRPMLTATEADAALFLLKNADPTEIAICWREVLDKEYGDDYEGRNLSFQMLARGQYFANWRADWQCR